MAYAATVSLIQILKKLLHSDNQLPQIQSLYKNLTFLQSILKMKNRVPNYFTDDLEIQIIDLGYEAEDLIESHLLPSDQYPKLGHKIFSQNLLKLSQKYDSITTQIENRGTESENPRTKPSIEPFQLSRFIEGKKLRLFGHENELSRIMNELTKKSSRMEFLTVVGMVGIGKTTLVKTAYDSLFGGDLFEYQAWANVGPNKDVGEILLALLKKPDFYGDPECNDDTEDLGSCLYNALDGKKYLIVLDDVCDVKTFTDVRRFFPYDSNGSRIIVTTRLVNIAATKSSVFQVGFLDEAESWDLLRYAAIGDDDQESSTCPFELVKIGKRIARNCQGLPLKIVVLGSLLSRMPLDPETWISVANNREIQNREMLKVTQNLDHERLPKHVKACFLYMVAFPLYQQISASKLFKLWIAEGFIETKKSNTLEVVARECLDELVSRSLVLVHRSNSMDRVKICSIHSALWPFYHNAAVEKKVFQSIENYKDGADPIHRRFSIHKNILFAINDVYNSVASVATTRSLLCTGPYHPYPLRVKLCFRLLRVLDALSIRFYEFPVEILKLVLLRFLALTLNTGELPASISNLDQLQFLIVQRHSSIKSSIAPCFLPVEIWKMKELRHLQVMGSDLPPPPPRDMNARLPNLLTLLNVGALSCTKEVFKRTPNLKKLGFRIELSWDAAAASVPLILFEHLSHLHQLETLKCIVKNPIFQTHHVLPRSVSVFPSSLRKITLSGCGFSWEEMKQISRLPNLQVLKLQSNAFRGPEWEVKVGEFWSLKSLLLQDLDLEKWSVDYCNFPVLKCLAIHHCYKLVEIPSDLSCRSVELVDCSPSVVDSAMRMKEEHQSIEDMEFRVSNVHSAWIK